MGTNSSCLQDLNVGTPHSITGKAGSDSKIEVCPASAFVGGLQREYTVFLPSKKAECKELFGKAIEGLKSYRHPGILKYVAVVQRSKEVLLVAEKVLPLEIAIQTQENDEIYAGLLSILQAVLFLNEVGYLSHGNINVSSVFVTPSGMWKLGSFENSTKISRLSKQSCNADINGYAEFALSVLEYLQDDSTSTRNFMSRLETECLSTGDKDGTGFLRMLLSDVVFSRPFLGIMNFLENLTLKTETEKDEFFQGLKEKLLTVPPSVICRQLIPLMFSHIVLSEAAADKFFLSHLFASGNDYCVSNQIEPLLSKDYFVKYCVQLIVPLFESKNLYLRLILIKYLPLFVDVVESESLRKKILPQILLGLCDSNDDLVVATFHGLAYLVPVLGSSVVVGGSRELIFYDGKPDFTRSNPKDILLPQTLTVSDVFSNLGLTGNKLVSCANGTAGLKQNTEECDRRQQRRLLREERKRDRDKRKYHTNLNNASAAEMEMSSYQQPRKPEVSDQLKVGFAEFSNEGWEGFETMSNQSEDEQVSATRTNGGVDHPDRLVKSGTEGVPENHIGVSASVENIGSSKEQLLCTSVRRLELGKADELHSSGRLPNSAGGGSGLATALHQQPPSLSKLALVKPSKGSLSKPENEPLGSEFSIKVNVSSFGKYSEPDYFADILAEVDVSKSKVVITKAISDNKFNVAPSNEGTDHDCDDGWENEEW